MKLHLTILGIFASSLPIACLASANPTLHPQIQTLPPLRDQAKLVDGWTEQRKALIPGILRKYGVDAWLVRLYVPLYSFHTHNLSTHTTSTPITDKPTRIRRRHRLLGP